MLTFACDASCCRLTGSFTAESFRAVKQDVRVKVSPNSPCSLDVSGLAVVNSPILSVSVVSEFVPTAFLYRKNRH